MEPLNRIKSLPKPLNTGFYLPSDLSLLGFSKPKNKRKGAYESATELHFIAKNSAMSYTRHEVSNQGQTNEKSEKSLTYST
jgi:hypothetical protein